MSLPTYDAILDLFKNGAAVEAQEQFTALHENAIAAHRREQIHALASEVGREGQLILDGIAFYRVENGRKNGPFCQRCYETNSRLEKLRPLDAATYVCLTCKMECERNLCG